MSSIAGIVSDNTSGVRVFVGQRGTQCDQTPWRIQSVPLPEHLEDSSAGCYSSCVVLLLKGTHYDSCVDNEMKSVCNSSEPFFFLLLRCLVRYLWHFMAIDLAKPRVYLVVFANTRAT